MQSAECRVQSAEFRVQSSECRVKSAEFRVQRCKVNSNNIENKSFEFAVRIVNLYKFLTYEKKEFVLSKQVLRSGTSIGANIAEAQKAQSKADFNAKMNISLKEANETYYWLRLLYKTEYIGEDAFVSLENNVNEIISILVSICKQTNK